MSTRSVIYNLQLNSNVSKILQENEAHAKKLDASMWQLQKSLSAFGVGLGAHFMKDFALDMIEGATEMERAMLRIKNVSESSLQGIKNQLFIRGEVDKFKIDLQDATDAYGDFLTMVRGTEDLSNGQIRKLHDELLTISKVTGLGNGQMEAAIRNLGKMLEEGALEGKHLKPLSYQLSGLMPYIARELDVDGVRAVSNMITSGIGRMNISSTVLADAIEKYSNDLLPKLEESLQTIESHTNDAKNAWLEFKNELVLDNKSGLNDFIDTLRDGAKWLTDHKEDLIETATALANIGEFYIKWRLALMALQAPSMIFGFINTEMSRLDNILGVTAIDTDRQAVAQNALNVAMMETVKEFDATVIAGTAAFEAYKGLSESEFALANNIAYVSKEMKAQQAILTETSTQLTLFTESQIYGKAFTPTQAIEDEYTHKLKRLQELQAASDEFFEKEQMYGIERESMEKRLDMAISRTNEIYAQRLLINQRIAELEASTVIQGGLFTQVELELLTVEKSRLEAELAKINVMDEEFALMQTMNAKAIADAEKLGMAWFETGGAIEKTAVEMSKLVSESKAISDAFVVGAEKAEAAWDAYFISIQAGMNKLLDQQIASNYGQLGLSGMRGAGFSGSTNKTGASIPPIAGNFIGAAMNVFMVGMGADLLMNLTGVYGKSELFKEEEGFWDKIRQMIQASNPMMALDPDSVYELKADKIEEMNDLTNSVQDKINKLMEEKSSQRFNPLSPLYGTNTYSLDANSKEIYKIFEDAQKKTFLPLMETVFGLNNKSERLEDTYNKIKSAGFSVPFPYNPYFDQDFYAGNDKDRAGSHKIDKIKNERIKGNSSHYITINIDEMNGMNNPTFTVASSYDISKIEKQVGDALVKVLTGVVNDSQIIGN